MLLAPLLAAALAFPQDPDVPGLPERIDALFATWDRPESPGAAVAVLHLGDLVHANGYGSAQLEHGVPITKDTVFHVASISKQLTAFAICLLEADGELSLDDPVQRYVPEVPDFGTPITLRHLLQHTSGLRDQWESLAIAGWRLDDVITTEHVLTFVSNQRDLNFPPGSQHLYCNTGYTLLGVVVERVSGRSFPEYCREEIFEPLAMDRTHFHDDHEHVVPDRAYSYARAPLEETGFRNSVLSFANAGATSLFTTAPDLVRWLENFGSGYVGGIPPQERMRERFVLTTGQAGTYAMGVVLGERRGRPTISHGGADAGFRSFAVWFPEEELGIAVLSNLGDFDTGGLAYAVADVVFGEAAPARPAPATAATPATPGTVDAGARDGGELEEVDVPAEVLARYAGRYEGDFGVIAIEVEDGELWASFQGRHRGRALEENLFAMGTTPVRFSFELSGGEPASALFVDQSGGRARLPRLETPAPDPAALAELAGRYWSEELGTFYDLAVEDDGLVARHRRHGRIALTPTRPDVLEGDRWFFGRVEIQRDADGAMQGFLLQGSRVRNVRFERTGPAR